MNQESDELKKALKDVDAGVSARWSQNAKILAQAYRVEVQAREKIQEEKEWLKEELEVLRLPIKDVAFLRDEAHQLKKQRDEARQDHLEWKTKYFTLDSANTHLQSLLDQERAGAADFRNKILEITERAQEAYVLTQIATGRFRDHVVEDIVKDLQKSIQASDSGIAMLLEFQTAKDCLKAASARADMAEQAVTALREKIRGLEGGK